LRYFLLHLLAPASVRPSDKDGIPDLKGANADRQLAVYRRAMEQGAMQRETLMSVTDHLIAETTARL
jgi:branched-subunit amino acid aminotransferase/4-amino-4-deoxychorismate lyase